MRKEFSSSANRKIGVILQYGQMILGVLLSILYTPILLSKLSGTNEYAVYSFSSSIVAYLPLLSLGFAASYLRFYSKYNTDKDDRGIAKLNGLYLIVFSIIGFLSLIIGGIIAINSEAFFNLREFSDIDVGLSKKLILVLTINTAISFPASLFTSYVTSQEKFIFQKFLSMFKSVLTPVLIIIALFLGGRALTLVLIITSVSFITDIYLIFYCFKKLKMRIDIKRPNFALLKDLLIFSIFIAINQLVDQLNWQTDKILLTKLTTGAAVTAYTLGSTINSYYMSISSSISSVFAPSINMIVASKKSDKEINKSLSILFNKVGRIQFEVLMLIILGFIFFGKYFMSKWASGYEDAYYIALLLIIPVSLPLIQNTSIEIRRAKNKHKFVSLIYLGTALFNVAISVPLIYFWGAIGAATGTFLSVILNTVFSSIYNHRKVGIDIIDFWKEIFKVLPSVVLPSMVGVLIMIAIPEMSLISFIAAIFVFSSLYCLSLWAFGLNNFEKKLFSDAVKGITNIQK
jgi:O-antigen/teichoic acid export membrane protein